MNYRQTQPQPLWLLIVVLLILIGAMIYVTRNDPDSHDEAVAVAEDARSPYQRRKDAEDRMEKRIAAAYAKGRADGCRNEKAKSR